MVPTRAPTSEKRAEQLELVVARARARQSAATAAAPSSFDTAEAVRFLDQIFGEVNSGRLGITAIYKNGRTRNEHFQWLRAAAARAQEWDAGAPVGIYFRCTMLPPQGIKKGRGGADDAHCLPFLWADLDYGGIGHKAPKGGLPLPPTEEAAREIIAGLPAPTLLVHSGGGLYPIWQFEKPLYITDANRAEVKVYSQRWQNATGVAAERLGWHYGTGVGDLARVLRLPGSVNRKDGLERPCRVIEQSGEVFPWKA
jgi:putative DNA primase/helicase